MVEGNKKTAYCQSLTHFMEDKVKVHRNDLFTETQLANGSPGKGLTLECAEPISFCKEYEKCVYHSNPNSSMPLILLVYLAGKLNFPIFSLSSVLDSLPSFPVHCCVVVR